MNYVIPREHWSKGVDQSVVDVYRDHWEDRLRQAIAVQPDPAARFDGWLKLIAKGRSGVASVRLLIFEQPYLSWADAIEEALDKAERDTRELIADQVLHPDRD